MKTLVFRIRSAFWATSIHLLSSLAIALLAAALVFGLWYPFPYRDLAGGRELFLLVVSVDVICGPLLTLVLFNPAKPRSELWRDLGFVATIQLLALCYGIHTVYIARPLFLVQEIDRFKVIAEPDIDSTALASLPATLQPQWREGPKTVAIREPNDAEERKKILFESVLGGRDFGERPEFYLPYEGTNALKSLKNAKPLTVFLKRWPDQQANADRLAAEKSVDVGQWVYLPVLGRQDWIAILDKQGKIQGFLKGNGF